MYRLHKENLEAKVLDVFVGRYNASGASDATRAAAETELPTVASVGRWRPVYAPFTQAPGSDDATLLKYCRKA